MGNRTFKDWLEGQLEKRQIPRRELARRMAAQHPEGVTNQTIETYRRAIYKYLGPDPTIPSEPTRNAFAAALDVDPSEVPSEDDEEEPDLAATLQMLTRDLQRVRRQMRRRAVV